jgi:hypothetical protein
MRDLRFVAHLDILGMSSIVERDADAAWDLLTDLVAVRDKTNSYELEFLETKERVAISDAIRSVTFSDTILLFTMGSSDTDLRCMIVLVTEIFHKALCKCVPIRVGISFGKFYFNFDKSMYAGPALIDAYRVGESAQWLGIALSESVTERAVALNMTTGKSKIIVPWVLPLKDRAKPCSVINWPAVVAHDFTVVPPLSVEQFYQPFESMFGALWQLPPEVQAKYRNTIEFLNEQIIRHAET